uniref:tRNA(Ile)-lysidine synthase, chloroplastic n=1 Tax=Laurencieae sp. TaxID=2007162 RepID=A0A1Z1M2U9_9FLOR|nr:tRNA Ile-lysidine synthetase [Laurencieae sp.]
MNKQVSYQLNKIIKKTSDKNLNNHILVAISGGQDSLYMIKLIEDLIRQYTKQKNNQINISYIYVDHQWRKDSYKQTIHVINYIRCIERAIYIYQLPKNILSENLSRVYRYHIITKHAIKYKNKLIVTGHNQTDKIETFLYNFFRGSGTQGTTSLTLQTKINNHMYLLRPLLNLRRDIIYWTCKRFNLPIWSDTSNYIYDFHRNRTRYELIPYIKKYFNSNIEGNLNSLLKNYYKDNEYIKQNTIKLYLISKHPKYIAINHHKLRKQNLTLQFKVIQLFCIHNLNFSLRYNKILEILIHINKKLKYINIKIKLQSMTLHIDKKWMYVTL